ncbi:MAG TPA: asparagine synthase (glutamine-hydrolyzing) [Gammaproteobacteria bacterium]|nr:asparagine synthase (glutamine-hydrolyzing) [Gammaproteobacteria bacterium]
MVSASGRYVIVLNGEVYNFFELRSDLEQRGYPFRGNSDTEVALAAIEHHGLEEALTQFVGMFAIGLWDRDTRRLFLARDRVGEKPIYYGNIGSTFVFASDLNAIRKVPGWAGQIDRDALGLMMQHFYVPAPRTIYQGMKKLLPGTWLRIEAGDFESDPVSYWSAADRAVVAAEERQATDPSAAIDALESVLRRTIRDKMIADVPLGAFLSGGVDSSTIVALMQAESMDKVKTFSIGFADERYNEAHEARQVANHLGTEHRELYVTPAQAQEVIPKLPELYSEPFADSSQIPTYLISALARRDVTIALSGDGGDELFGGYTRYLLAEKIWRRLNRIPDPLRFLMGTLTSLLPATKIDNLFQPIKSLLPDRWRYKQLGNKLQKLGIICQSTDPEAVYKTLISMWERPSQVVVGARDIDMLQSQPSIISRLSSFTERMMLLDLLFYLPGDILTKVDRASMGESLEVRVPFLDHRVVEHAWRIPLNLKVRGNDSKWLLKQVLFRFVPKGLIDRPKMGFGVPIDEWLRGPMRAWAEDLLEERVLADQGFFHAAEVRQTWDQHLSGTVDCQHLLWPILMFQAWLDYYGR